MNSLILSTTVLQQPFCSYG